MFILRNRNLKVLVLLGAITLIGSACEPDDAAPNGGEEALPEANAPADPTLPIVQSEGSELIGPVGAPTDLPAAVAPDEAPPPADDPVEEIIVPGPEDLRTATFALG